MAEFYCGHCAWLDYSNKERYTSVERYWCNKRGGYHKLTEQGCNGRDFMNDPNKSKSPKTGFTPSGFDSEGNCHLSTIATKILGYEDNSQLLNLFRDFRAKLKEKNNAQTRNLLLEYDCTGLMVCNALNNIENYEFCSGKLKNFILKCAEFIEKNKSSETISTYYNMIAYLQSILSLPKIDTPNDINIPIDDLGRGRLRFKNY